MKKMTEKIIIYSLVAILQLGISIAAVQAAPNDQRQGGQHQGDQRQGTQRQGGQRHHDWSHAAYRNNNWFYSDIRAKEPLPFSWHEHHERYYGERIDDAEWNGRFPGLHSYKWRGEDFWYRGRLIRNCILFYDDSDELVSIGFMDDDVFVFLRDDNERYDNHDSSLLVWWRKYF